MAITAHSQLRASRRSSSSRAPYYLHGFRLVLERPNVTLLHWRQDLLKGCTFLTLMVSGCAPIAGGPPPIGMAPGVQQEFGTSTTAAATSESPFLEQNLWLRKAVGNHSELQLSGGIFTSGDLFYHVAVGYRFYFQPDSAPNRTGIDFNLGDSITLKPVLMSFELTDRLWLTAIHLGSNPFGLVKVPPAVWNLNKGRRLDPSVGTRFMGENPTLFYGNVGLSFPF